MVSKKCMNNHYKKNCFQRPTISDRKPSLLGISDGTRQLKTVAYNLVAGMHSSDNLQRPTVQRRLLATEAVASLSQHRTAKFHVSATIFATDGRYSLRPIIATDRRCYLLRRNCYRILQLKLATDWLRISVANIATGICDRFASLSLEAFATSIGYCLRQLKPIFLKNFFYFFCRFT